MSRATRVRVYLREMCPPQIVLPTGLLKFGVAYVCLQGLATTQPLGFGWRALLGGLTVGLVMLLMRIYDELKDVESDMRLGKAGDPRYRDRPIVRGAVQVADVLWLRNLVVGLLWLVNLSLLQWSALGGFALLFSILWLSSHFFFWPAISKSLLLALLTHNPITLFLGLYVVAVFAGDFGWTALDASGVVLLLLSMWLPVAAWETSRKLRLPADETAYETYSKLWGLKRAALVPAAFVALATAASLLLSTRIGLPALVQVGLVLLAAIPISAALLLSWAPTAKRTKLQPFTEAYAGLSDLLLLVAVVVCRGVEW